MSLLLVFDDVKRKSGTPAPRAGNSGSVDVPQLVRDRSLFLLVDILEVSMDCEEDDESNRRLKVDCPEASDQTSVTILRQYA